MRRDLLEILRCPRCRGGPLAPEVDTEELLFGPVRCAQCEAGYPVADGLAELVLDREPPRGAQRALEQPWVARAYERYVRPAVGLALSGRRQDPDAEYLLYRSLLGAPRGRVLDVGCGTGLFSRKLAREPSVGQVIGLDVSRPMLEEAMAQAREAGVRVDFLRAEAPWLPLQDASVDGVLQAGSLHLIEDEQRLFAELFRVLRPEGRCVLAAYPAPRALAARLQRQAGVRPRTAAHLHQALVDAGFTHLEQVQLPPFIVLGARRPGGAAP
jgi:ubiquinone/menaquinone biosynthesis C-methylase UbiE/uncharacterized protein YbaR (Trm112 family)